MTFIPSLHKIREEYTVGIIRNHLLQMKVENPAEYRRLMEGYESEDDFVRDVCGLSIKAIKHYYLGGSVNDKRRPNSRSVRSTKQFQKAQGISGNKKGR